MKKFIFVTREGSTSAPNPSFAVDNFQVVGFVEGALDEDDALRTLLRENPWIIDAEFNVAEFVAYELA